MTDGIDRHDRDDQYDQYDRHDDGRAGFIATALAAIFALAIGFAVGYVATFTHGQYAPWGLIVGIVVIGALTAGFRLVFDSRVIGAAAALGAVAATLLLTQPGAGGRVLVLDEADPVSLTWAIAPAVLALVVIAWPRLGSRRAHEAPVRSE